MVLTLEIRGPLAEKLGRSASKVFDAVGGTIGRLSDNAWSLPDPYISGRHALIRYIDGVFYLEDTSTNGVFVNSQDHRLSKGQPYAIKSGDWIFIEPYEIKASITSTADDPFKPFNSLDDLNVDPLLVLQPIRNDSDRQVRRNASQPGEVIKEHYAPPRPVFPANPTHPEGEPLIPDNYNPLITEDHSARLPSPLSVEMDVSFKPVKGPGQSRPGSPEPVSLSNGAPDRVADDVQGPRPGADLRTVLAGAGLEGVPVSEELARDFGAILRTVVGGLMEVLQARQRLKNEFRIGATTFKPADNNPLKFSANVDDALHNLLVKRNAAYLGPVEAFEDAFEDVKNHHVAMLAGIRVAFEAMLLEFDPEHLQAGFDRQLKKGALLSVPAKLRYWDLYREKVLEMLKDVDTTFRELFGDEFARAYEEQLKRLKAQARVPRY